jgi:hypothetical protein
MTRSTGLLLGIAIALTLVGCAASKYQIEARFERYSTAHDGTRIAIVEPVAGGAPEMAATVDIGDLKNGDMVVVEDFGRNWDLPQWKPSARVISRVASP